MARAVLGLLLPCLVLLSLGGVCGAAGAAETDGNTCSEHAADAAPEAARTAYPELRRSLMAGPFFRELSRRFGRPVSCSANFDNGNITITFVFQHGSRLSAHVNPAIEASEQRAELGHISAKRGLSLLKAAVKAAYGSSGCGIDWTTPVEETNGDENNSRDTVYRGNNCNCQARITRVNDAITALVLRSAC